MWRLYENPSSSFFSKKPRGQQVPTKKDLPNLSTCIWSGSDFFYSLSSSVSWRKNQDTGVKRTRTGLKCVLLPIKPSNNPGVSNKVIKRRATNPEDINAGPVERVVCVVRSARGEAAAAQWAGCFAFAQGPPIDTWKRRSGSTLHRFLLDIQRLTPLHIPPNSTVAPNHTHKLAHVHNRTSIFTFLWFVFPKEHRSINLLFSPRLCTFGFIFIFKWGREGVKKEGGEKTINPASLIVSD